MRVRLAWALVGLTALVAVTHLALLLASDRPVLSTAVLGDGFPIVTVGAVAGAAVGALIVSRYPGHPVGWLFVVGQLLSEVGLTLRAYGYSALSGELGSAPGGHVATWLSVQTGGLFVVALLAVLFLLAPEGRPPSPRWRWALALPVLGLLLQAGAVASVRPAELNRNAELVGGDPGPVLVAVTVAASLAVGLGVLAAAVSLVRRLRGAGGEERQQLRWMALAAGVLAAGVVGNLVLVAVGTPEWTQSLPVMVGYACVPFLSGIAILRYRLYEIDLFLNRALLLAVLTGFVAVGYVCLVVLLGAVFSPTRGALWPSLLALTLVALAFQPVRQWLERLTDRLVYGARAAPYLALAEFGSRLQEVPGTEDLLRQASETIGRAVGARHVTVSVLAARPGHPRRVGWPDDEDHEAQLVYPLRDEQEELGSLAVALPPGVALRPAEQRLVADVTHQLGRALRNVRLEHALAAQVERLRERTVELSASTQRLSSAQVLERERFQLALARDVLPHLHRVRAGLVDLRGDHLRSDGPATRLEELNRETTSALESLRTLTRGMFPAQLARRGLAPTLASHLAASGLADILHVDPSADRRFDPRTESACYFCAVESLRELDRPGQVRLTAARDALVLQVSGTAGSTFASRTAHLADRAAALAGSLEVSLREGTATLRLEIPVGSGPDLVPDLPEPS